MMKRPANTMTAFILVVSLLVVGGVGCGKYGPPERAEPAESSR